MKNVTRTNYPRHRKRLKDDASSWSLFCSSHARQILTSADLPPSVREALDKASPDDLHKAGYRLVTFGTHPAILQQGELMLWPINDEPIVRPNIEPIGDLFRCQFEHPHGRLYQGDSLTWLKSLPDASINLVFADPPYNLRKADWDAFESPAVYVDWYIIPTTCNGMEEKTPHPTQKPEELLRKLVLASSKEGERVLDPFSGSGTTLVVAEQLNRHWLGCDLSDEYNHWAIERIRKVLRRTVEEWIQFDRNTACRRDSIR